MNSTLKKLIIVVIGVLVFTNVLLLRSWIWIIENEMMMVDRFEEFQREQLEYSQMQILRRLKREKRQDGYSIADKIRNYDEKHTKYSVYMANSKDEQRFLLTTQLSTYTMAMIKRTNVDHFRKGIISERLNRTVLATTSKNLNTGLQEKKRNETTMGRNKTRAPYLPVANVYMYGDLNGLICNQGSFDTYALQWNPLFPELPTRAGFVYMLEDENRVDEMNRKIIGYLRPTEEGFYEFQLSCTHFCDFVLTSKEDTKNFIQRISITLNNTKGRGRMDGGELLQRESSEPTFLDKDHDYLFDITSLINRQGMYRLRWRRRSSNKYVKIPSHVIRPFDNVATLYPKPPPLRYFNKSRQTKLLQENPRNVFWNVTRLPNLNIEECIFNESHLIHIPKEGEFFTVKSDFLYPHDETIAIRSEGRFGASLKFMTDEEASKLVNWYMHILGEDFSLKQIVHLERSLVHVNRLFVQIDVTNKNGSSSETFRSSGWIHVGADGSFCNPQGFHIKPTKNIYLLTPVRNQRRWISYFVEHLNRLVEVTGEKNIHLIMVEHNSTDCDVGTLLEKGLFNYTLLRQPGKFNKVKSLNLAVRSIKEHDAIVFVFDLQLQFPLYLFDAVRMHTFPRVMAYVPIMLRNACAEHPEYTPLKNPWSHWTDAGFGMIAMYKSDWLMIGGMNETQFGEKWGGEDWDLASRVLKAGIEISHHRLPGYYHLYHDSRGMWDGTKLY